MQNTGSIEQAIRPFKVKELAELIAEKKKIPIADALYCLYTTRIYKDLLFDEAAKGWYLSGAALYEMIEREKRAERTTSPGQPETTLFLVFCLGNYKALKNQMAEETLALFTSRGVLDFLKAGFDVLHTQGKEYIMQEIDLFLRVKN
jgi:hypothetical protein